MELRFTKLQYGKRTWKSTLWDNTFRYTRTRTTDTYSRIHIHGYMIERASVAEWLLTEGCWFTPRNSLFLQLWILTIEVIIFTFLSSIQRKERIYRIRIQRDTEFHNSHPGSFDMPGVKLRNTGWPFYVPIRQTMMHTRTHARTHARTHTHFKCPYWLNENKRDITPLQTKVTYLDLG